jgi:hypothetical protein
LCQSPAFSLSARKTQTLPNPVLIAPSPPHTTTLNHRLLHAAVCAPSFLIYPSIFHLHCFSFASHRPRTPSPPRPLHKRRRLHPTTSVTRARYHYQQRAPHHQPCHHLAHCAFHSPHRCQLCASSFFVCALALVSAAFALRGRSNSGGFVREPFSSSLHRGTIKTNKTHTSHTTTPLSPSHQRAHRQTSPR